MIEVNVNGIFLTQSQASGIILKEKNGSRTLPIVIGEYEDTERKLGYVDQAFFEKAIMHANLGLNPADKMK